MDPPPARTSLARRLGANGIGRYIAVSEGVASRLRGEMGVPSGRIRVVRNAVPVALFDRPADAALRRSLLGGAEGRALVLTVARLDPQKGLPHLLEAAAEVPEAVFLLAGEGAERAALEAQAARLGLGERLRFLGHRDDIPALLSACDLFVLPSLFEGFPLAVLEASAAGKPVVATAVEGTREAVRHGETGILVPPAAPSALAGAIRDLLSDAPRAARIATAAKARAQREFGPEAMARQVHEIYDELLGSGR
jgi:glycosyltransferase involved in cell wall biosynthesis